MILRNILYNCSSDIATQCTVDCNVWKIKTLLTRSIIIKYWNESVFSSGLFCLIQKLFKLAHNSEQKIIFRFLSHFFGVKNLKVSYLFVFDNSKQKIIFRKN